MAFTAEIDSCFMNTETGLCEVVVTIKEDGTQIYSFTFTDQEDKVRDHFLESAKYHFLHWKERVEVTPAPSEAIEKPVWNIDENTGDLS